MYGRPHQQREVVGGRVTVTGRPIKQCDNSLCQAIRVGKYVGMVMVRIKMTSTNGNAVERYLPPIVDNVRDGKHMG